MSAYLKRAVVAMDNAVDAKILSVAQASTPAANQISGAAGAPITLDASTSDTTGVYSLFVQADITMSNNNVPPTTAANRRWAIVRPSRWVVASRRHPFPSRHLRWGTPWYRAACWAPRPSGGRWRPLGISARWQGFQCLQTPRVRSERRVQRQRPVTAPATEKFDAPVRRPARGH